MFKVVYTAGVQREFANDISGFVDTFGVSPVFYQQTFCVKISFPHYSSINIFKNFGMNRKKKEDPII